MWSGLPRLQDTGGADGMWLFFSKISGISGCSLRYQRGLLNLFLGMELDSWEIDPWDFPWDFTAMSAAGLITGGYITDVLLPETLMEMYRFSSPYPPEIRR